MREIPLELGVLPMTVVAFMEESKDSLLLAADQQFTRRRGKYKDNKLRRVKNQQIAWSSAGNPQIGLDDFGEWINRYDFTGKDWGLFIEDVDMQVSMLSGERK